MILHPPFIIGLGLYPALQIADSTLYLLNSYEVTTVNRNRAIFLLVTPAFEYMDKGLESGVGGFRSRVDAFEAFLGFLSAAVESAKYESRTGLEGECTNLFPLHVVDWAVEHIDEIKMLAAQMQDEDGNLRTNLIKG